MSDSESEQSHNDMNDFSLPPQNSFQSDYGLPREVLETLTNFSVSSPGMLYIDLKALEVEFREEMALLQESLGSVRSARLYDIVAYCSHETVVDNLNGDLLKRLFGLTTAHVLVCLERDDLRRFKRVATPLLVVLVILILLGLVAYLLQYLYV